MNTKFYITTTLPYVNDVPHIGHTLEFIQADIIARFYRKKLGDENVWFNVGTDEHGLKIFQKAQDKGLSPSAYTDLYASKWQDFCQQFLISYTTFYRTTGSYHKDPAQAFWRASLASGDIYKKKYESWYCVGCEAFKTEKELVDGKCPDHNVEPIWHSEENYFFRLSKYRDHLLGWLESNPEVVRPSHKVNELRNWIKDMEDISISRIKKNLPWGIEVPDDPEQVMYVWFDALTNYVNVLGYSQNESQLKEWWPGLQLFGPDNLRFQGAIWQAMLASAGLEHSQKLLCHGMINDSEGRKMSKTVGNVVSPFEQAEKFGVEAIRFYLTGVMPTFLDGAYSEKELVAQFNSILANSFGNLLTRVVHLSNQINVNINRFDDVDVDFRDKVDNLKLVAENFYESFDIQQAVITTNSIVEFGNKYIDTHKPWISDSSDREQVLVNLGYLLNVVINLYEPVIPVSAEKARDSLARQEKIILFKRFE